MSAEFQRVYGYENVLSKYFGFRLSKEEGMEEGTSLLQIFDWSIQSRVIDVFT